MATRSFREGTVWQGGGSPGGVIVYPSAYFMRAYVRAAVGIVGAAVFWAVTPGTPAILIGCLAVGAAFAWYAAQTRLRQVSDVSWDNEGISIDGPLSRRLSWTGLKAVTLSYFSTRRDGSNGWMQLKISGKEGVFRLDSDADGFDRLVVAALQHADRLGLDVTATTRHNAAVLIGPGGIRPSSQERD